MTPSLDRAVEALKAVVEADGGMDRYHHEDDDVGERACCGVVSYKPHEPDCYVTKCATALAALPHLSPGVEPAPAMLNGVEDRRVLVRDLRDAARLAEKVGLTEAAFLHSRAADALETTRAAGNRSEPEYDRELIAEMLKDAADGNIRRWLKAAIRLQERLLREANNRSVEDAGTVNLSADNRDAAGVECHCGTCTCHPGMTKAIRYDTAPAGHEAAIREHLIGLGWTPPGDAPAAAPAGEAVAECETCGFRPPVHPEAFAAAISTLSDFNPGADEFTEALAVLRSTHPPAVEVDEAMVERACKVAVEHCWPDYYDDMDDLRAMMRAALTAARLPAAEVREVDEAMVGRAQTAWYAAGSAPCSTARDWMRAALTAALTKED